MTAGIKTLIVKNFKGVSNISDEYLERQCKILESAITAILKDSEINITLEKLYGIVENVHQAKKNVLYDNLNNLFEHFLLEKLEYLLENDYVLLKLDTIWRSFCRHVQTIKNIFLSLDKSSKNKYNTINVMSMILFKTLVVLNPRVKKKLTEEMFYNIELERKGKTINLEVIQSIIGMFTELQVYDDMFQTEFLKSTETFYIEEGNMLIQSYIISDYLKHVNERILEEQDRAKHYLSKYTGIATLELVYKYLIKEHIVEILDKGFNNIIDNNNLNELFLMYNLLKKVACGVKYLSQYFLNYILKEGTVIVYNPENDKTMIESLLVFKEKLDHIVEVCFKSNDDFFEVIRNAFVKFVNIRKNKPAQLLAKFLDKKMRSKDLTEADLKVLFDKIMVIFRFIQGKDIFEAFYKRDLAKRLLLSKSTSQDAEDSMIAKLKNECGDNFTSKIEGMFNDISISQSINEAFKQHLKSTRLETSVDLCINILTNSFWPNYPNYEVNLPDELVNYQLAFQKFYAYNHSGRKLIWQPNLGHCIVKGNFEAGNKELQVSLFQTLVLLLFDKTAKLSYLEIRELTNLEDTELKKTILSLACGKARVLLKSPKGIDLKDEDLFIVNKEFTDKLFRVKINQVQLKETAEEEKAIESSVMVDRQFQIDAAIVRIMKKKMSVNHNALLAELFNTLDIPVKPHDLKKRIELLIEREYMERDKDNPANYTYIA
ncbi:unnamed protein product [Brassicogethes aeneus]|uniref:Cullin-4 n=1 Tax=Brassicogethes aeneus TaxID=1431903 RepID=A0A9P0B559_BRAAE|nr:unnamed protein product [Brassicogethes aeneus]